MRDVIYHRLAAQELRAASSWYGQRSELVQQRFRHAIWEAADRIREDPQRHASLFDVYRCVRVNRFPFVLIYSVPSEDRIFVVAVAHTSRKPGYWHKRR